MDNSKLRSVAVRLVNLRADIIKQQPFFGRLLMHLPFAFEECGTAYTDMRKIVFDPSFADSLHDAQLGFVLLHECMHCVLKHCIRGKGRLGFVYNVACDIVVNSVILEAMGLDDIVIGGEKAMHLTPCGQEGREYSAEEVYHMLLDHSIDKFGEQWAENAFDNHTIWEQISSDSVLEAIWSGYIDSAAKSSGSGIPNSLERLIGEAQQASKISWKQILHDFLQCDRYDYLYTHPDRRFSDDIIMPSFCEDEDDLSVDKIWFLIDTSASVSDRALTKAINEVKDAIRQVNHLCGFLSFFDCEVTEPIPFESVEDVSKVRPVGGGGTSFDIIFNRIDDYFDALPRAIIIITDGYATFPDEAATKDVPVFWIMVDSEVEAPWGECVHIPAD